MCSFVQNGICLCEGISERHTWQMVLKKDEFLWHVGLLKEQVLRAFQEILGGSPSAFLGFGGQSVELSP